MISEERIKKEFISLAQVDAPSRKEREITDRLKNILTGLGFEVREDDAAGIIGGNAGNIYAFLEGQLPGPPLLFVVHTDTVEPACGKEIVTDEQGRITSAGETVLGGDDLCGVVEILEGVRHLREENIPHRSVEVLMMAAEEIYGKGAKAWDYTKTKAKEAYVLDLSGDVGRAAVQAPSLISFEARVHGKAAHAGFAPETGVHAIAAASKAIASLTLGHLDAETTLNIGKIYGGEAENIVPELCTVTGEVRSSSHERALKTAEDVKRAFEQADPRCKVEFISETHLIAYHTPEDHPVVQRFRRACKKLGFPGETVKTFGGSDNNILMLHGITGIVLSCGMENVHSTREYTTLRELKRGAMLVAELLKD